MWGKQGVFEGIIGALACLIRLRLASAPQPAAYPPALLSSSPLSQSSIVAPWLPLSLAPFLPLSICPSVICPSSALFFLLPTINGGPLPALPQPAYPYWHSPSLASHPSSLSAPPSSLLPPPSQVHLPGHAQCGHHHAQAASCRHHDAQLHPAQGVWCVFVAFQKHLLSVFRMLIPHRSLWLARVALHGVVRVRHGTALSCDGVNGCQPTPQHGPS